ncbi:monovalent cation/H(+) antiporter subunit G [Brevibacterium litoralis]|uniref:monovalent cation/H(+) antiporter subunit G n=1 Tax=Brevibacterium litoralis TaxID=3138935 RepID=UPI0032F0410D
MILDVLTVLCVAAGGLLSLAGAIGLFRFPDLLSRLHAASKPQVLGLALALLGAALQIPHWGPVTTMLLVLVFQLGTTPVGAHMIGRAAYRTKHLRRSMLYRDELAEAVDRAQARADAAVGEDGASDGERDADRSH